MQAVRREVAEYSRDMYYARTKLFPRIYNLLI